MDLFSTIAFLASAALPQEPAGPPSVRHADRLPENTVAVISVAPWEASRDGFRAAGLDRLVADQERGPTAIWRAIITRWIGADTEELTRLGSLGKHGFAVAFVGPDAGAPPGVLALIDADAETTGALRRALSRRAESGQEIRRVELGGVSAFEGSVGASTITISVQDDVIVLGSSRATAAAAANPSGGARGPTLADSPRYARFLEAATAEGEQLRLVSLFIDAEAVTSLALTDLPRMQRDVVAGWIDDLGLSGVDAIGMTITATGDEIDESVLVVCPEPRSALITALAPAVPSIDEDIAKLVPADVSSFGVGHVMWLDAAQAILGVVERRHPASAEQARGMMDAIGAQLGGIDLERDILATLGARMISMQWGVTDTAAVDSVMLLELRDAGRLAKTLARLPFLESSPLAGYELFLAEREDQGALAIGEDTLVVASTERRLRSWIAGRKTTTAHPEVRRVLGQLLAGANGFGWVDLRGLSSDLTALLDATPVDVPGADLVRRIATETLDGASVMRWTTTVDELGFRFATRSPSGTITRAAAALGIALTAELAEQPTIAVMVDRAELADRNRDARVITALEAIRTAQATHREEHGTFAGLDRLTAEQLLPEDLIVAGTDPDVGAVNDSFVTVLLNADGTGYAAVSWPNEQRTGPLFACDDETPPQRNDLIAHESGLNRPELPDLFVGGRFDDGWTPGWRVATTRGQAAVLVARGSESSSTVRVLAMLEKQGEAGAEELVGYLDHDDPMVVSRAAWGLGNLRHAPAVPRLIDLVGGAADPEVRKHAMRALLVMEDSRTGQVSIDALQDDDAELRCFAAANLGQLGQTSAANGLVSVLARATTEGADDRDAVAALLALEGLGQPGDLLGAATAFNRTSAPAHEALTWLFQQLSPGMDPKEESTLLMAVLDHEVVLLRRYAIQRLGELADPLTVGALEARLANEDDQLRPLIEVSIAAARGATPGSDGAAGASTLGDHGRNLLARAEEAWNNEEVRTIALSAAAGLLTLLVAAAFLMRKARRRRQADNWAEKTRPSEEFGRPRYEDYDPDLALEEETDVDAADWPDEGALEEEVDWEPEHSPRI